VHVTWNETGRWLIQRRGRLVIAANLGQADHRLPLEAAAGTVLAASADGAEIADGAVHMPARSFAVIAA
jgi:hypothetical protein